MGRRIVENLFSRSRILASTIKARQPPGDAKHFDGISELRIDYGPGYRIYVARKGKTLYLLLCGGDKSSQQKDIERAKKILAASSSPA
ncbi:type II toxin-antitoxin system RelE/ParE family toxin [Rhodanobacter ginsengisoli]|uniref:Type II toxin-antitoxin system RelE/ParE family toxin n=1 Tax=Rhodanobacter ginsengisoli TaxID=418646 RepID=A0ABW0QIH6_9GAMM